MSSQIRYDVSMETAKEILEYLGIPNGAEYAACLSYAAYVVLEAIYRLEGHLATYSCAFLCPRCFRQYRINVEYRGREVRCVRCGHRWRAPEIVERN